jgi:uncharacterized protein DUF5060/collagenase-like protein with putative collagen-binding domain
MAKTLFRSALPLAALTLAFALAFPSPSAALARFDTAEIALRSTAFYSAAQGSPNPFDLAVTAIVTSPSGRRFNVDGFFDGDGAGGSVGNVFKVRIYADEAGTWSWTTSSAVAGLNGQRGTFGVSGTLTGVFGQGPVVENPSRPRSTMYQYGGPVYLLGKFLDVAAPDPIKYSHTLFSEKLTDSNRQAMLSRHLGMKLNKMNVYIANKSDYTYWPTTPWLGTASSNDKRRFDLKRWRTYDQWVVKLRNAGLVAQLWFFADDSSFGSLADADRQRLIRYAMARTSGYVNTSYTLCLEWQEGWTSTEVNSHANYIQQWNPWARMVSVHGTTGNFSFPTASWADYMDIQSGNSSGFSTIHTIGLANRALAAKPLINEEFTRGSEDTLGRQKAWAAFTAGAAGSGTGAYLKHLATLIQRVAFHRMDPADALVRSGSAYVLAEKGQAYVAYLYNGGTMSLDLTGTSGSFVVEWFDPRGGTFRSATAVTGGAPRSFTAPGSGDWTLFVHR